MSLKIDASKFYKYAEETGAFNIVPNGDEIEIIFTPSNPDALDHFSDSSNARIILKGKIRGEEITFEKMLIQEFNKCEEVDRELLEKILPPWLESIELSV